MPRRRTESFQLKLGNLDDEKKFRFVRLDSSQQHFRLTQKSATVKRNGRGRRPPFASRALLERAGARDPLLSYAAISSAVVSVALAQSEFSGDELHGPAEFENENGFTRGMASPTGGIPEWTREVPGEVQATGGGKAA